MQADSLEDFRRRTKANKAPVNPINRASVLGLDSRVPAALWRLDSISISKCREGVLGRAPNNF